MATITPEAPKKKGSDSTDQKYDFDPVEVGRMGGVYAKNQEEIERRQAAMRNGQSLQDSEKEAGDLSVADKGDSFLDREKQGSDYTNKFTGQAEPAAKNNVWQRFKGVALDRKKGPFAAIIGLVFIAGAGIMMLVPHLLMIHVSEIITEGKNMQGGSMDRRTAKVYASMMKSTSGFCASKVTVRCRYRSMNDDQIKKLEAAGIKVIINEGEAIQGRKKVDALEFKGKTITASSLSMEIKTNYEFREATRKAYNPWFAGFADKVWTKVSSFLGISKKLALGPELKTDEERIAKIQEDTKNGQNPGEPGVKYREEDGKYYDAENNEVDAEMAEAHNRLVDVTEEISKITGEIELDENPSKLTPPILEAASGALDDIIENPSRSIEVENVAKGLVGGVLQAPDTACRFYGYYNAISFGAKTIRAIQMARFAMIILNTASAMKAGEITPENAAFIGALLTMTVTKNTVDSNGKAITQTTKAATDSLGYRNTAYGDTGPLTPSATEFLAGGGFGGKLTGIADGIISAIPGGKKNMQGVCKIVNSPFAQAGSILLTVGLAFTGPLGWGAIAGSLALGAASEVGLSIAASMAIPILTDMVAGVLVDDTTFGERAGDALVSGSGVIMSTLAAQGGNAPLRPAEAVAYMNGPQDEALAAYKEEDRKSRSPLDPTSPNTFMGMFVSQLIPYSSKTASFSNIMTTSFGVTSRSLRSIIDPSASAAVQQTESSYRLCDDEEYKRLDAATDIFCNPIRGIPSQYLEDDPVDVITRLVNDGFIDEDTGQAKADSDNGKRFSDFVNDCINRQTPLGYSGENFDQDDGKKCFIESSDDEGNTDGTITLTAQTKADIYVYHIDQRILDGIDNGYDTSGVNCGPSGGSGGPNQPTAEAINARIAESEATNGWTTGTSPLGNKGQAFIDLGAKYGINPGVAVAILQRESQLGTAKEDVLVPHNNFGGNTANPGVVEGDCGTVHLIDRDWKKFCTPEAGLEGLFQNLDSATYRETDGTLGAVMEIYAPRFENDWGSMLSIFNAVGEDLGMTINESTQVYTSGGGGSNCRTATGGGAGFSAIWGGEPAEPTMYAFGVDSANGLYGYGANYGLNGLAHTGIDVVLEPEAPLYSPVNGTITCAGTGNGPGAGDRGCSSFNDYFGHGNGKIEIEMDNGHVLILGHTSTSLVKVGDRVTPGQQVGTNGGMNSWHVHVEYRVPDPLMPMSGYKIYDPENMLNGVTTN